MADLHTPPFLKAWEDYVAASQSLWHRFNGGAQAAAGSAIPPGFLDAWQEFARNLGMPSDRGPGGDLNPEGMLAGFLPGLGYTREYQQIGRRLLDLCVQFRRRYADLARQGAVIGQTALQAVHERSASDEAVRSSPAALYDAWIDSAEEAYAQAAHTEGFARLLAELCNIMSAFKVERSKLLDALARELNWPGRAEIDGLHRQVGQLIAAAADATSPRKRTRRVASRVGAPLKPKKAANKPRKASRGRRK